MASNNRQSSSKSSRGHGAKAPPNQNPKPKNPHHINPSETRDSFKPPLVLSGSHNYSKWCKEMSTILVSKNKFGFVDGSIAVPAKDHNKYAAWKRGNDLVLSWIVKAVSPEIAKSVHGKDKAVDVWRDLKKRYSPVDHQKAQQGQGHKQQQSQPSSSSSPSASKSIKVIPKSQPGKEVKKVQTKVNRAIHPHPLTLKPSGAPYKCSGCQELGFGPSYCCQTDNCSYVLHKDCANVVANNSLVFHRFFKESNFVFYKKKPDWRERYCNACGNDVLGFFYHCHTTGKDLHPCCLKLKDSISDRGRQVTLKLCDTVPKKCLICKGKRVENDIKGWSYVSSDGDYCCHVSCFKKSVIAKWKDNYFSKEKMALQGYDHSKTQQITLRGSVGGSSSLGSETTKMLTSWVFRLIFSLVFGNPTPLILGVLEHVFN